MLIPCPACGAENIEGADECGSCHAPLAELSERAPQSSVEAQLMVDTADQLSLREHACVPPSMAVEAVLKLMVDTSVGCVMVVDDQGCLSGIFSERDAVTRLGAGAASKLKDPISKYMTSKPVTIGEHAKIASVLQQMDIGGYRHLPVLDANKKPVQLISIRDILNYLSAGMGMAG